MKILSQLKEYWLLILIVLSVAMLMLATVYAVYATFWGHV
jgi:hypothetical protein